MPKENAHILIAGGGTGGHLFPALAIADEIKKKRPDTKFVFVGTKDKIEARIVPQRGYEFATIWISGFRRSLTPANLLFPAKIAVSLAQSFFLINRFRPDVVIGTGGYVCGPVLYVASIRKIPTVIHESNSYPGITTRMLSPRAAKVFTAFDVTNRWLKRTDNVERVGTPTCEVLDGVSRKTAKAYFGLNARKQTVLVVGGSLGASSVNRAVNGMANKLISQGVQLVWQTGSRDFQEIRDRIDAKNIGWVGEFIDHMEFAYAAADVVVSRSGATTIAELTRIGKPAILVPFPFAAADHQTMNARTMADAGAAIMMPDSEVEKRLEKVLVELLQNNKHMKSMAGASKSLGKPDASQIIAEKVLGLIH